MFMPFACSAFVFLEDFKTGSNPKIGLKQSAVECSRCFVVVDVVVVDIVVGGGVVVVVAIPVISAVVVYLFVFITIIYSIQV